MKKTKLWDELVAAPDGGYYKVTVTLDERGMAAVPSIPGRGKVTVYKKHYQFPEPHDSFAWKIKEE